MRTSLVLRLAGFGLLAAWVSILFSIATSEFMTNERKPMTAWQSIVKMVRIMVYDEGRFLRQDLNVKSMTIVVPRDAKGGEFVDVTPPERASVFVFLATVVAGLVLMGIGAVIGLLPRTLMLIILGVIVLLGFMYYLNQRPLIPLYMKMPDAAVYVIMYKTMGALVLAFASGLLFVLAACAVRRPTRA